MIMVTGQVHLIFWFVYDYYTLFAMDEKKVMGQCTND